MSVLHAYLNNNKFIYRKRQCTARALIHDCVYMLFSSLELAQLTGVAAILRFPMPELEDSEDDDDDDDDDTGD